jgi:hypothetical protein
VSRVPHIACPACSLVITVSDAAVGTTLNCPQCRHDFVATVPTVSEVAPEADFRETPEPSPTPQPGKWQLGYSAPAAPAVLVKEQPARPRPTPRRYSLLTVLQVGLCCLVVGVFLGDFGRTLVVPFDWLTEPRITARQVWEEFDRDTHAANQKYKGRTVQITGQVRIVTIQETTRFYLAGPEGARWSIEFVLPSDQKHLVRDGDEVTLRCRFAARKGPDGNLMLSTISLVK